MNQKDYYKILEVDENASPDEIKKSYRNLAFRYHPDRSTGNEEMMKEINEAYAVLSNSAKRNEYDSMRLRYGSFARDQFRQSHTDQDIFRDSDIGPIFEELSKMFGFSRPEDIFSRNVFYGPHYRTFEFRYGRPYPRNANQPHLKIQNPLLSMFVRKIAKQFQKYAAKGLGLQLPKNGKDLFDIIRISREEASGGANVRYLYNKQGNRRELLVTLPPGIKEGQKIKLKGLGEAGKRGGKAGDLYLKIKIRTSLLKRMKSLFGRL